MFASLAALDRLYGYDGMGWGKSFSLLKHAVSASRVLWGNQFTFLPPGLFRNTVALTYMSVKGCALFSRTSSSDSFSLLLHSDLDNNPLSEIPADTFSRMTILNTLSVYPALWESG